MSVQALGAVVESGLFSKATYQLLIALSNHADETGYVYIGYDTMAFEARCTRRHVIRLIDELAVYVGADAQPKPSDADKAAAPIWLLSYAGSPRGTNEYRLNLELFRNAREARRQEQGARRRGRPKKGVTSEQGGGTPACGKPPEKGGDNGILELELGVTEPVNAGDKIGQGGDARCHPNRVNQTEPHAGARANPPDWIAARRALKAALGRELYARDIAPHTHDGAAVVVSCGQDAKALAETYGTFFKHYGFECVRGDNGAEIEL